MSLNEPIRIQQQPMNQIAIRDVGDVTKEISKSKQRKIEKVNQRTDIDRLC